ncbi:MAG: YlxM family DNA-binding protein [Anaeroplasmataceae bacterium]
MMDIKKREDLIDLFEIYGSLLTEKQREYFKLYYFSDYSFQEISENFNVSRNAIFDQLKKTEIILEDYESKLHIKNKTDNILKIINDNKADALNMIKEIVEV